MVTCFNKMNIQISIIKKTKVKEREDRNSSRAGDVPKFVLVMQSGQQ